MTIQLIFNHQHWSKEASNIGDIHVKLNELVRGKIDFDFLPALYSEFTNIPFVVNSVPFSTEITESPDALWYRENVYPLNRDADILIFVCRQLEWNDNPTIPGYPYGYCFNQWPITFPPFISMMVQEGDKSWKFKKQSAFVHYISHELGHCFSRICEMNDRTHDLDYSGNIQQLYDSFDYEKIKVALLNKRKLDGQMANFYTVDGNPTIYADVEGKFVGFSTDMPKLLADWPTAKIIKLSPDEMLKAEKSNHHTLAKRN